jgi:sucrose-6-phosphate hydrolase SacC (GH32 family)
MEKDLSRRDLLKSAGLGAASLGVIPLMQSCAVVGEKRIPPGGLYNEKYRPQFHFTPRENWTNDPNGLVYYKGEYHLFFQHNPSGINWGNMTWGHAVSGDLMHWREVADAIKPDELGTIFSGSAVVDWKNTSGLQTGKENVLVAFYTAAGEFAEPKKPFTQCIAYSNDRGKTWVKYKNNPIIEHIRDENRDPKVIWYEPTKTWIMALYLNRNDFVLMSSNNLKDWEKLQDVTLAESSECPDFFPLAVEGEAGNVRWVFWGANGRYLLGDFDGKKFTVESGPHESRVGNHYASQTYSDIPESDGRRIQIAWMAKGKFPDMPFNQQMSIPCELKLRRFGDDIRLCMLPVKEIGRARGRSMTWKNVVLDPGMNLLSDMSEELFEIQAEIEPRGAAEVGFNLRGNPLVYNVSQKKLSCRNKSVEVTPVAGKIELHILVDRTSIEIFPNEGLMPIFLCFPLDTEDKTIEIFGRGGQAKIRRLRFSKLKSIWV